MVSKFKKTAFTVTLTINLLLTVKNYSQNNYQTTHWKNFTPKTIFLTYDYMHRNTLKTGIEFFIPNKSSNHIFVGLGYGVAIDNGKLYSFPTAHLSLNLKKGYVFKLTTTSSNVTPSAGISLFNVIDFNLGYSIPYQKEQLPELKGISAGITVRISKNNDVYLPMTLF